VHAEGPNPICGNPGKYLLKKSGLPCQEETSRLGGRGVSNKETRKEKRSKASIASRSIFSRHRAWTAIYVLASGRIFPEEEETGVRKRG